MTRTLTVEELERFKTASEGGVPVKDLAKSFDRSEPVVYRLRAMLAAGTFDAYVEKQKTNEKMAEERGTAPKVNFKGLTARIVKLYKRGLSGIEVSKKLGVSGVTVYAHLKQAGVKTRNTTKSAKPKSERAAMIRRSGLGEFQPRVSKREKILKLADRGFSNPEIAAKLGIKANMVSYYRVHPQTKKEQQNGHSVNGNGNGDAFAVNRNILIGIAFAETERFLTVLGERIGLAPSILRPRLSELLGHSPLRQEPGHSN